MIIHSLRAGCAPRKRVSVRSRSLRLVLSFPMFFFHQKINRYILRKLLRHQPSDYRHTASHKEGLNEIIDSLRAILRVCDEFSAHLEQAIQALRIRLAVSQHKAGGLTRIIHIHNAAMALLEMLNTVNADVRGDNLIVKVSLRCCVLGYTI